MRKEVAIAIALGFALGLVITFGIWSANKALKEKEISPITVEEFETASVKTTPSVPPAFSLSILSPEDESLQKEGQITLSGSTEANAQVIIIAETDEQIIEADSTGKFEAEVKLTAGTNEITVTASNSSGDETTKVINVVYSTAEI